ncbi:MAG TPA: hypothetical protein DCF45_01755 [Gammaproteobacteria bacterium]|nr:hypothetical protein [Gammaproteobacteria bacterium]
MKTPLYYALFLPLTLIASLNAQAQYAAFPATPWGYEAHDQRCLLEQTFPSTGAVARFEQRNGQRLTFELVNQLFQPLSSPTQVYAAPPVWRHDRPLRLLGKTTRQRGTTPFRFSAELAEQMLVSLENGNAALLSYPDLIAPAPGQTAATDPVHRQITLTPAFLSPALIDFRSCVIQLAQFDVNKLDLMEIRFNYGSADLDRKDREMLDQLVNRLPVDQEIKSIRLSGFTDSGGLAHQNSEMARMRVLSVANHLISAGIDPAIIDSRYSGGGKPRYSNRTATGRAGNRRVDIELIR